MYDAVVIGLGAMGSAACWKLAARGARVLGLEQFEPVHDRGSSHGQTRICRKAYFEHPDYVPLLRQAYREWDALAQTVQRSLFERVGLVLFGRGASPVIQGVKRAADRHALAIERLSAAEARRRFVLYRPDDDMEALYEADAGYLRAEACVEALAKAAQTAGAELRYRTGVHGWSATGGVVRIQTASGEVEAARLVVTAGAWSARLLSGLGVELVVLRKMQLWARAGGAWTQRPGPVFAFDDDGFFYGFPPLEPGLIKVAEHSGAEPTDPDAVDRSLRPQDQERVRGFVERRLVDVAPEFARHSVCLYTMSPDGHFIIDRHPEHEQVVFAAGLSGHGFKFAPVIGVALSELALDGASRLPIEFLARCRPALERGV